jgi:hypothetical protein
LGSLGSNGTDEGVLRDWLDSEQERWFRASETALRGMIEHLQHMCFVETWDDLRGQGRTETEAGRITLEYYEDGIGRIFGFLRACGALPDEDSWTRLKAEQIEESRRADVPQPLVDAQANGLTIAERREPGDHKLYCDWSRCLMLYFYQHAAVGPRHPGFEAERKDKLAWAAEVIEDVRDRDALLAEMTEYLNDPDVSAVAGAIVKTPLADVLEHQRKLTDLRRFDLVLHTGTLWLIDAVERE